MYPLRIERVIDETSIDRSFFLRPVDVPEQTFRYEPGQFVVVRDPAAREPTPRAYSISSAPCEGPELRVTVRDMGQFGHTFFGFGVGKVLSAAPPRGRFTPPTGDRGTLVLFAGGSGVTPFRSYVVQWARAARAWNVVLLQSVRRPEQRLFGAEFDALAAEHAWLDYRPTVTRATEGQPWSGHHGRIDAAMLDTLDVDWPSAHVRACGPRTFVDTMLTLSRRRGVCEQHLRREAWG